MKYPVLCRKPGKLKEERAAGRRWAEAEMKIRFFNARLLTMANGCELTEGELWTREDRIAFVGSAGEAEEKRKEEQTVFDREIDCRGNVLMPGFKNAHTHSGMTVFRSYADGLPLQEWLNTKIFPIEAKMSGEDIYHLTRLAILEYLTTGVTAIGDMYLTPETIAEACSGMGMRCQLVSGLNDFGPKLSVMEERYLSLNGKDPLISYSMGLHAEYTCQKKLLEQTSELLHKYRAPLYIHVSETAREVEECRERYGVTPPVLLDSLGLFDFGGCGYHCVHFTEEDRQVWKKRGLSVVTNPGSNTKLASGIAPLQEFLQDGLNVAIGTDGPSSNNCLDMFREMFLTTGLAKLREQDAAVLDAEEVLRMATVNGALAMGMKDSDVLAEGKYADLILIDLHQPNMQPLVDIARNIVYSGSKTNVKLTMVAGRILYEDGAFPCCADTEEVYRKANELFAKLTG